VVGRSKDVRGPSLSEDGSRMLDGGSIVILKADLKEQQRLRGPGYSAFLSDEGRDYIVHHAYDREHDGAPNASYPPCPVDGRWLATGRALTIFPWRHTS
jgi:arabinan endo-1,5-alpha-L-arabinosidase